MKSTQKQSPTASPTASAAERFFRAYHSHCIAPDLDTLFNLLNAIHSLNDKLRKEFKSDFFTLKEFVALKALRNLFHHQEELLHEVRIVGARNLPPITTDLMFLCLVPRSLVENSITSIDERWRSKDEPFVREALKWYGNVVNINPCIFNFAVHVYERMNSLNILLKSDAFYSFKKSYEFEVQNGHSHFVSGDIACHVGSIDSVLETVFADVV